MTLLIMLLLASASPARGVPGVDAAATPEPPTIAAASGEPAQARATFGMPEGFVVELFAAEPDVANPVAFSVDEQGRAYVCETFRQERGVTDNRGHGRVWVEADLASQSVEDRISYHRRLLGDAARDYERYDDRVRRLVDTDGDGRADRAEVFASGFNRLQDGTAAGILARRGDVSLTCIPSLYRLRDLNGDDTADGSPVEREVLSTGYGARVAYRGHDLHGLTLGPDGRIYFTIGDRGYRVEHDGGIDHDPGTGAVFRCEPDGSHLEVFARGMRNPQELAFDDLGNLFTVDNNSDAGDKARVVHLVPGAEVGWNMAFQYLDDRGPWHREKIWHTECEGQPAWCLPPIAHACSGPSGFAAYPGTGLTPHFEGRFLLADFSGGAVGSSIRSFRVKPHGGTFAVCDEEQTIRNVLATDVEVGPDGALWVSDWVHGWGGEGKGRLWRFLPRDRTAADARLVAEVRSMLAGDWGVIDDPRLVALLGHVDRRIRLEAQWELVRRAGMGHRAAAAGVLSDVLGDVLGDSAAPRLARIHAAQGLGQILRGRDDAAAAAALVAACDDSVTDVRMVAARALGDCPADSPRRAAVQAALARRLGGDEPHVRVAAATSLGQLGRRTTDEPMIAAALVDLAGSPAAQDRTVRHAASVGLATATSSDQLDTLVTHESPQVRLVACVALRRLRDPRLTRFLDDANEQVAIEAARAIHDLPLPGAFAALAARAAAGPADDAFIRRAVSAAEQLGTADATTALLAVLARDGVSLEARQEAIDALRRWATPPRINRVTGEWLPSAAPRDVALARDALAKAVAGLAQPAAATLDESLRASLLTAASAVGVADIAPTLRTWCGDAALSAASRAGALDALLAVGDGEVGPLADRLVGDREPLVRMAARRVRAAQQPTAAIVPDLVTACGGPDLAERQQAVSLLAGISQPESTAAIAALAARLRDGSLDPTLALEVGEAAALRLGEKPDLAASPDPLASWHDVLAGGDPARGRGIFLGKEEVSCVRCHQAGGTGGDVGPKLDSIAKRCDPRSLLESIVLPNARVADGYATTVIITDEGLTISGVVTAEDAETVSLRNADGRIEKVAVTAIDERASGPSSMPADLAAKLSRRELRDLLAWLQSLK